MTQALHASRRESGTYGNVGSTTDPTHMGKSWRRVNIIARNNSNGCRVRLNGGGLGLSLSRSLKHTYETKERHERITPSNDRTPETVSNRSEARTLGAWAYGK
jgi:hypothetical protein